MREVEVIWNKKAGPYRLESQAPGGFRLEMDNELEHGGSGEGFSPKNLLLISLAGCTGMDVLSTLRKMRQEVTGYRLAVKGWEHNEHPRKFDKILVEHIIEGRNLNPAMVNRALKLSHEKYCGVSASLAGAVEIEMTARLVEPE